jgi:hypothetical protein
MTPLRSPSPIPLPSPIPGPGPGRPRSKAWVEADGEHRERANGFHTALLCFFHAIRDIGAVRDIPLHLGGSFSSEN